MAIDANLSRAEPERVSSTALNGVAHGFFGARAISPAGAGVPLQCGFNAESDPEQVERDRTLCSDAILPGGALVTPQQVHSAEAVIVDRVWGEGTRPQADAVVTSARGIVLGVVTADCAPILFADREAGIIAAAHAGWRGAVDGIIESSLAAMEQLGAQLSRVSAAIGPCIAQDSYEVDAPFRERFADGDDRFFRAGQPGHWQFDLEGYVGHRLAQAGVRTVDPLGLDTYALTGRFHSYRRATHGGAKAYGRQLSLIGLQQSA